MPRPVCACFVVAAVAAVCQAQTASVDGRVANSVTGEPVPGATVHLMPLRYTGTNQQRKDIQTTSLGDGTFHLESVSPGTYLVRAEHSGFTFAARAYAARIIEVKAVQNVSAETILLTPDSTITGQIVDDQGAPIAGARVMALAQVTRGGRTVAERRSTADSSQSGAFTLTGLQPGNYLLAAQPPARKEGQVAAEGELVRTMFPRALDLDGATTISVAAGQSPSDLTIYLRRAFTHHVRGKVSEVPTERGLQIYVTPRGASTADARALQVALNKDGTFDAGGLLPGAYTVQLTGRRAHPLARQDVDVAASDIDGIVLNPAQPVTIDGALTVDSGMSGALPRVQILVRHLDDHAGSAANVNADGSFMMTNLDPEPSLFRVVVSTAGFYVKSVLLNQQDVKDRAVDLTDSGHAKLEIVLRQGAGEIDGSLPENAGGATIGIVVVPRQLAPDGSNVVLKYSRTDGTFAIPNLAPGEYFLYAVAGLQWGLWQTPEFLEAMRNLGTPATVVENQRQQLQLKAVSQETIDQTAEQLGLTVE